MNKDEDEAAPLRLGPADWARTLDEQFANLGQHFDRLADRSRRAAGAALQAAGGKALGKRRRQDDAAQSDHATRLLGRRTRVRLAELHLRVGQSIEALAHDKPDDGAVRRQLFALLQEIERIEQVLARLEVQAHAPEPAAVLDAPPFEELP